MCRLIIEKSPPLKGNVKVNGAKNSVLPILASTILTEEKCVIKDVPNLTDVSTIQKLLQNLGVQTEWNKQEEVFVSFAKHIENYEASYDLVSKMRASFLVMGPLLARMGKVRISLPGGCRIGARPVELHLKGLIALGAEIVQYNGFVEAKANKLKGAKIYLDFPSVGATENIMMAAVLAEGQTVLENCATEPEVVDLANFLIAIGADIRGAGTNNIKINGVDRLTGGEYRIMPDRIEAGTFMVASAITRGDITVENVVVDHLKPVVAKLKEANVEIEEVEKGLRVYCNSDLKPIDIKTLPHPGFPTDMQAQMMSLMALTQGTSIVTETVFENRFMHASELRRMGAEITIEGRSSIIEGVTKLTGAHVRATDLRAGAGLVLAGMNAFGTTEIHDVYHIDRGYYDLDKKLMSLGARITRKCD